MKANLHRLLVVLCLIGVVGVFCLAIVSPLLERQAAERCARIIPIPPSQTAYRHLRPMAFRSDKEWRAYLARLKATELIFQIFKEDNNWDRWPGFEKAINDAKVSFPNEVLVIVPYVRGSSSVEHMIGPLRLASTKLYFNITRNKPGVRTADMSYGCFAFAVKANVVQQIELRVDGRATTSIDLH